MMLARAVKNCSAKAYLTPVMISFQKQEIQLADGLYKHDYLSWLKYDSAHSRIQCSGGGQLESGPRLHSVIHKIMYILCLIVVKIWMKEIHHLIHYLKREGECNKQNGNETSNN